MWEIGKTEEGRPVVALAVADEATIKSLDTYKQITAQLSDPRKLSDQQARQLIQTGKPIYYATGSIHSSETGSPEMLMELAFRLAVEETPFIEQIRNNIIVVITPVSEVDGRERQVDNRRATEAGQSREWYRPFPAPPEGVQWSGRANINTQESAILIAMNAVAKNREMFLENYYAKNKMMIEQGRTRAPCACVIPSARRPRRRFATTGCWRGPLIRHPACRRTISTPEGSSLATGSDPKVRRQSQRRLSPHDWI